MPWLGGPTATTPAAQKRKREQLLQRHACAVCCLLPSTLAAPHTPPDNWSPALSLPPLPFAHPTHPQITRCGAAQTPHGREYRTTTIIEHYPILQVGGYFSIKRNTMGVPMPVSVPPGHTTLFAEALLRVFRDHGPRGDRQQTRLMWLVELVGMEKFV